MSVRKYQVLLFCMSMLFGAAATVALREYLERKWFQGLSSQMADSLKTLLTIVHEESDHG